MDKCKLVAITEDNWKQIISLNVHEDQKNLVGPNVRSLAEAYVRESSVVFGIESPKHGLVGFIMYLTENFDGKKHIHRFMIDKKWQGSGFGLEALKLTVNHIWQTEKYENDIMIMFLIHNTKAEKIYSYFGFEDTGEIIVDEKLFRLPFSRKNEYL